jgi:PAS domain S-box-containing protein
VFEWGGNGAAVLLEDRTQQVMAEEENALLIELLDSVPVAISVHDRLGNLLYTNKQDLASRAYSLDGFDSLDVRHLETPASSAFVAKYMKELEESGETTIDVTSRSGDGREILLAVHARTARWGERDVIISIANDISERKKSEAALFENQRRLTDVIDFMPDATFAVDCDGVVIAWNRAIGEMTGVPAEEILGKGDYAPALAIYGARRPLLLDLIFRDDPAVRNLYRCIQNDGDTFIAETTLPGPGNANRVLQLKASPFYDRDGNVTGAIESIRDITELRRLRKKCKTK